MTSSTARRSRFSPWWGRLHPAVALLPALVILLFFTFALRDITLPGFYGDEATPIAPALTFIGGPSYPQAAGVAGTRVVVGGHALNMMILRYYGALKTMLFIPVAAALGPSVSVIRCFTLGIAAIGLLAVYDFTRRLFSPAAAVTAMLLLAVDQSFVFYTKVDWGPNALAITLKMVALWALVRWWQSRRPGYLACGGLTFGLALYNKADFAYMAAALVIATAILYGGDIVRALSLRHWILFVASVLVGASVFVWYNIRYPLASFRDGNPAHIPWWRPEIYGAALQQRSHRLFDLLNGDAMNVPLGILPGTVRPFLFGSAMAAGFVCAVIIAVMCAVVGRGMRTHVGRALLWLLLVNALFLVLCAATPVAYGYHHVINIYPFPHILIGVACTDGLRALSPARRLVRAGLRTAGGTLAVGLIVADILLLLNTYSVLEKTGGVLQWSDSIYQLADDLRARPPNTPIHIMDWGIKSRIDVLLGGRSAGIDEYWPNLLDDVQTPSVARGLLKDDAAEYISYAPGTAVFPAAWAAMQRYAFDSGKEVRIIKAYAQRDGIPSLMVSRFVPSPCPTAARSFREDRPGEYAVLSVTRGERADGSSLSYIIWNSGDRSVGQVYVSWPDQTELLFAQGGIGSAPAAFMRPDVIYTFRLYAGTAHDRLVRELIVHGAGPTNTPGLPCPVVRDG